MADVVEPMMQHRTDMHVDSPSVASLRRGFQGQILLPNDDAYEEARLVWNAMIDRRPAIIARCARPADVIAALRFGRSQGLEIGVRGGGHNVLGFAVPDGGLMLDLSLMASVRVDPDRRRAWVQGGVLLGALDRAAQRFGLATTAGNVSHTGVGGLTLGGGMGWLARQCGLACDNVASYEVVTADGEILHASETENADLFWGLRGGGGNFGVVTEFEFRLHPVGTAAFVVELFYRPEDASRAVRRWRDLLADAPCQATFTAWAGTTGTWPYLSPELHHRSLISVGYVWVGNPDQGRTLLPALRDVTPPIAERVEALTYGELQRMDDSPQRHRVRRYAGGHFLRTLGDEAIDAFISRGAPAADGAVDPSFLPSGSLQSYGGAIASVHRNATAFSHRDTLVEFGASAGWTDPAEDEARFAGVRRYTAAIEPFASGVYVNDLAEEGRGGVQRAYGDETAARLAALKDRYDPDNIFHLNHNIQPRSR
ncbi:MAG: linked oxidase domain protein [Chloroflexi bacterium]|nr:linked oxidase domain protein [Chloroflexota bacterium]